jgi:hypothetical protein
MRSWLKLITLEVGTCRHSLRVVVTCRRFSKKGGHGKQLGAMNNQLKYRTMTQRRVNKETKEIKAVMAEDAFFFASASAQCD